MKFGPLQAFAIGFALGFVAGFSFITLTFGLFAFLIPAQIILFAQLAVGIIMGLVFGILGLLLFFLGKTLGRKGLLLIAAGLFILGILTVQPEIDLFALLPLAFAFFGFKGRGR